jgi:preprotein translocase subunit SecG
MIIVLTLIHIIVCLFLVIVVLLQSGKAADLAGAFGGMGSQTAFGPRGSATILSKATTLAAGLFMVTSMSLAILATRRAGAGSSVLEKQPVKAQQGAPAKAPVSAPAPSGSTVPLPVGVGSGPVAPGQPSVTLADPVTGATKTLPLTLPPPTGAQKPPAAQQPASKPATPPKK